MIDKLKLLPPVYFFIAMAAMISLHVLAPIEPLPSPLLGYAGPLLVALGVTSTLWAVSSFRRAGTPIRPFEQSTVLVTRGLYRITRNPMYLGMVIALIGTATWLGTASPFLVIPVFIWLIQRRFIQREERFLENLFGHEYLAYKKNVRRWF